MTDELQALFPCPFCGGEAQPALMHGGGIEWGQVECANQDCSAVGPTPATEAEAIAAWNRRTERPALIAEVERLRGLLAEITPSRLIGESHVPYPTGKTTVLMSWDWLKRARAALGASHDAK